MPLCDLLDDIFRIWKENCKETEGNLGAEKAGFFVDVYNDAMEIQFGLINDYSVDERNESLVFHDFCGMCKEIHWLLVMFLAGNYPCLLGRLRFLWELIFRATYADTYEKRKETDREPPGPTIDDKHRWLLQNEKQLNWNTAILPVLGRLFASGSPDETTSYFKPLWDRLNAYVHPSGQLRADLIEESALLVRDGFDEGLANKALHHATEIFELIWLTVVARFPRIAPRLIINPSSLRQCPRVRDLIQTFVPSPGTE